MLTVLISLHVLSAIVWVGGMAFAILVLRPASGPLDGPVRLGLWGRVFVQFFAWVWAAVILLPLTGYGLIYGKWGGFEGLPLHAHIMHGLGWLMVLIFVHLWFAPYRRFKDALAAGEPPKAAAALNQIRLIVTTNLILGLLNAAIGASGQYWTL